MIYKHGDDVGLSGIYQYVQDRLVACIAKSREALFSRKGGAQMVRHAHMIV